jgi:hypothetical protein
MIVLGIKPNKSRTLDCLQLTDLTPWISPEIY